VVGGSHSCSRPVVLVSVRTWRTVRLVGANSPRGPKFVQFVACSCAFVVRSVGASVFGWERFRRLSASRSRTFRAAQVARRPSEDKAQTVHFSGCGTKGFVGFLRPSAVTSRTVHRPHVDRPPDHRGLSAWSSAECLSPLLLELRFRVALIWGLFLGLVATL
jgi:hypothetical protein